MTLSLWLRDHIYIPLGGNKKGTWRKYVNIMITFLVSGIWHGAAWNFVAWGFLHGVVQIVDEILSPLKKRIFRLFEVKVNSISHRIFQIIITFSFVTFAWIFFNHSLSTSLHICSRLLRGNYSGGIKALNVENLGITYLELAVIVAAILVSLVIDLAMVKKDLRIDAFLNTQGAIPKGLFVVFLMTMTLIFGVYGGDYNASSFVYFNF